MDSSNPNFLGRIIIASAIFWILQLVAVSLLYSGLPFLGGLSDISSAMSVIFLIPLVLAFDRYYGSSNRGLSQIAQILAIAGILATAVAGFLIAFRMITLQQSFPPVITGYGLVGVWLMVINYLGLNNPDMPRRFTWIGLVVGLAMSTSLLIGLFWADDLLSMFTGFVGLSQGNGSNIFMMILFFVGAPIHQFGFPVWAIWLGRMILSGKVSLSKQALAR